MVNRNRGFTLLEVLVALLVFGLIATAAAEVCSNYISSFERVRDKTLAGWLAEMARGAGVESCLEVATACGALACTGHGDWESAPTREDLAGLARIDEDPVSR